MTGQAPALQERAKFYLFLRFFDREHGLANVRGFVLVFPGWTQIANIVIRLKSSLAGAVQM